MSKSTNIVRTKQTNHNRKTDIVGGQQGNCKTTRTSSRDAQHHGTANEKSRLHTSARTKQGRGQHSKDKKKQFIRTMSFQ